MKRKIEIILLLVALVTIICFFYNKVNSRYYVGQIVKDSMVIESSQENDSGITIRHESMGGEHIVAPVEYDTFDKGGYKEVLVFRSKIKLNQN